MVREDASNLQETVPAFPPAPGFPSACDLCFGWAIYSEHGLLRGWSVPRDPRATRSRVWYAWRGNQRYTQGLFCSSRLYCTGFAVALANPFIYCGLSRKMAAAHTLHLFNLAGFHRTLIAVFPQLRGRDFHASWWVLRW